ncbi:MAG: class B sortase [Oscillospiraceae bacterium]
MKKTVKIILIILLSVILIACVAALGIRLYEQHRERNTAQQLQKMVSGQEKTEPERQPENTHTAPQPDGQEPVDPEPAEPVVLEKYAQLFEENPEIIGWLKLEGTMIDYPVMYTPDDPDKYLHADFYGNESVNGTLYLDEDCDIWTSDNLIIYGHNMKNGDMFGDLDNFKSESYWQEHKYITFDTIYEEQEFEIVAAFYSRIMYSYEEGFRYYQFINAEDEEAFNEYAQYIDENQCYDTGVDIHYGDQLLTLSTCAYHTENGRFVVVAKRVVPEGEAALDKSEK